MNEPDRYHNIIRSLGDWDKLSTDLEGMRERAKEAGFEFTIVDEACPCCGQRPVLGYWGEIGAKKSGRQKKIPMPPSTAALASDPTPQKVEEKPVTSVAGRGSCRCLNRRRPR
jgi:hypothetical protein